jgi:hypothetical protein
MRSELLSVILLASGLASATALAATERPIADQPMNVDGVQTVCTGGSEEARANPGWRTYRTRIEFAGKGGEYLGDETVSIVGEGKNLSIHCGGPWVLMQLPKGTYKLSADVANAGHKDMTIHAPGRTVVRFPKAG